MAATERCRRRYRTPPRCGNSPQQLYRYFFLAFRLGGFLRLGPFADSLLASSSGVTSSTGLTPSPLARWNSMTTVGFRRPRSRSLTYCWVAPAVFLYFIDHAPVACGLCRVTHGEDDAKTLRLAVRRRLRLSDLDPAELAWEFLRRNPAYQHEYRKALRQSARGDEALAERWGLRFRDRPGEGGRPGGRVLAPASRSDRRSSRPRPSGV